MLVTPLRPLLYYIGRLIQIWRQLAPVLLAFSPRDLIPGELVAVGSAQKIPYP